MKRVTRDHAAPSEKLYKARAAKILARATGVTEKEALLFVATVGDLRNGAVWGMGKEEAKGLPVVVAVEVPLS